MEREGVGEDGAVASFDAVWSAASVEVVVVFLALFLFMVVLEEVVVVALRCCCRNSCMRFRARISEGARCAVVEDVYRMSAWGWV